MSGERIIVELWSQKLTASSLYNIERSKADNPVGGGGQTYIQINKTDLGGLLKFLHKDQQPPNGQGLTVEISNRLKPDSAPEKLEFASKSAGRMRIARQNRHRHGRLSAWLPSAGFPTLEPGENTTVAAAKLAALGHVHIYLARGQDGKIWAGFTSGEPTEREKKLPFASLLWGDCKGGYWSLKE